jgi:nickel-dependent lactate racemase
MDHYFVRSKKGKVPFRLPETWSVLNNIIPTPTIATQPMDEMISGAIAQPIGSPPLSRLVIEKGKIVIILDDFTRPTPKAAILTSLVHYLHECGVDYDQIDILFGVGTHRGVTEDEAHQALGPALRGKIRWTNHNSRAANLVSVGICSDCGEVKINPLLAAADLRIGIGSVLPHPMLGFGGGAKLIMPGVSDFESIRRHHLSTFLPRPGFARMEGNAGRRGMIEAARLARLDFIINAVYNAQHDVMTIVAGDVEEAHEAGVRMSLREYSAKVDQSADVTIISAFPYEEGNQIIKPIIPAALVTKKGGTIVMVAPSIHGGRLPEPLLEAFDTIWAQFHCDAAKGAIECIKEGRLIIPSGPLDFNAAAYLNMLLLNRVRVTLISPDVTKEQAARLGFGYAQSIEQAIHEVANHVPDATVNILPSGGMVVPLVKEVFSFEE